MTDFALDGHKLMYHPGRVHQWLRHDDSYPIYIEISLVNKCNYRCSFCAFDYTAYKGNKLEVNKLKKTIDEMAECGVKSIVFAGTGEPLTHPGLGELVAHTVSNGIDVGLSTNGALLNDDLNENLVAFLSWIRISFNAGTPESYGKIHGCPEQMFHKVKENISRLTALKKKRTGKITIGVQCLMLEETKEEFYPLAAEMKALGVDYFSLKPFSPHPDSINTIKVNQKDLISDEMTEKILSLSSNSFKALIRRESIAALDKASKPYDACLGLPFLCYVEADGLVYACNTFVGDKSCTYGNINEQTFQEIWTSEKRKEVMSTLSCMTNKKCRQACRLDQINKYLWALKNPGHHVNFI